jgi:hypothetical protein
MKRTPKWVQLLICINRSISPAGVFIFSLKPRQSRKFKAVFHLHAKTAFNVIPVLKSGSSIICKKIAKNNLVSPGSLKLFQSNLPGQSCKYI